MDFLRPIIVGSTDKYIPSRTDGRALGSSLDATKCKELGKIKQAFIIQFTLSDCRTNKAMLYLVTTLHIILKNNK